MVPIDRELTLELVRATEAAALAAAPLVGKGEEDAVDRAAVNALRAVLNTVDVDGRVAIGEGELDDAPRFLLGERLGNGQGEPVDIAVDPVEGTSLVARGLPGAIAVVAIAPRGKLLSAPDGYMEKVAVGPAAAGAIDIEASPEENVTAVAHKLGKHVQEVTVVILDRPRHARLVERVRRTGARIRLIPAGDVAPAIATALEGSGLDILLGSGGAPEGVLAAAALRCLGGDFQGRLVCSSEQEAKRVEERIGRDPYRPLRLVDLVGDDDVIFAATGITTSELLRGVRFTGRAAYTHSLAARAATGTIRFVEAVHQLDRKPLLRLGSQA